MRIPKYERGSVVLFVVIVLAVLLVIGVAALEFTRRDLGTARVFEQESNVQRCSNAARNWIVAQYRINSGQGVPPGSTLAVSLDGDGGPDSVTLVAGGHYSSQVDANPQMPPSNLGGVASGSTRVSNVILSGQGLGGGVFTAVCKDGIAQRQYEIEFAFQAKN